MGMIFNSERTSIILGLANKIFNAEGFAVLKGTPSVVTNMQNLGNSTITLITVAKSLGLDLNIGSTGAGDGSVRWKRWCDYMDATNEQVTNTIASKVLGQAIYNAFTGNNINYVPTAIEFFAVPASQPSIQITPSPANRKKFMDVAGTTMVITIMTPTVDAINGNALPL